MTYEQAKEIALKINARVNACKEYAIAYHFYDVNEKTLREPDNDVVVLKATGKTMNFSNFILQYLPKGGAKKRKF